MDNNKMDKNKKKNLIIAVIGAVVIIFIALQFKEFKAKNDAAKKVAESGDFTIDENGEIAPIDDEDKNEEGELNLTEEDKEMIEEARGEAEGDNKFDYKKEVYAPWVDYEDEMLEIAKGYEYDDFYFEGSIEDFNKLIMNGKPSIITFGSESCTYCEKLRPVLKELKEENKDVNIVYLDTAKNQHIAAYYPVQVVPATMVFKSKTYPVQVTEDMFINYGLDAFGSGDGDEIALSAFFGYQDKENVQAIIDLAKETE